MNMPFILCIGGNDPTGGAGLTMDTRVGQYFSVALRPIVSCITAQDGHEVAQVDWVSQDQLLAQLKSVCYVNKRHALPPIIKIGLFANKALIECFVNYVRCYGDGKSIIIFDPIIANGAGKSFLTEREELAEIIDYMREHLLPLCTIITPNHHELAMLSSSDNMDIYCEQEKSNDLGSSILALMSKKNDLSSIILSGGHGENAQHIINTHFYLKHKEVQHCVNTQPRFVGNYRGTGCALGSAIACQLSLWIMQNQSPEQEHSHPTIEQLQVMVSSAFNFVHHAVSTTYNALPPQASSNFKHKQILRFPNSELSYESL